MAKSASASKLFSAKAEEQVFTLMLIAQAEKYTPYKALRMILFKDNQH